MNRRFDVLSLVAGVLYVVLGVLFLLDQNGSIRLDAAVVVPVSMIALGIGAALSGRDR